MGYKNRSDALAALAAEIGATPSVKELPDGKWAKVAAAEG